MFSMNKPIYSQSDEAGLGTLYVGGLDPTVVDINLFETFSAVAPVSSVRVCRDRVTQTSLGYGYVNFQTTADAQRVLDTMNFTLIKGKPCRLMWQQKDSTSRDKGLGNIYIKNLDESIDNKTLFDTFSMFGRINSCKVAIDKEGTSLGYGFVHYLEESSAETAIEKINGMMINEKKVEVVKYIPQKTRSQDQTQNFTNIYSRNFAATEDETMLKNLFIQFGEVDSMLVPKTQGGQLKGYLFCNFKNHESAVMCIEQLNGANLNGHSLVVGKYKSKSERAQDFANINSTGGLNVNLFVKNMDPSISEEELQALFSGFGVIKSYKIMRHAVNHQSRGFGFICFENEADASKAMAEMNGKNIKGKEIYVGLAQKKTERVALLAKQFGKMTVPTQPLRFGPPMHPPHHPGLMKRPPPPGMVPGMMMPYGPRPPAGMNMGRPNPGMYGRRPPPNLARSISLKEQKQAVGEKLYPLIQRIEPQMAGKITGMLLEMNMAELHHLVDAGGDLLLNKINEAVQILKLHNV